MPRFIVRFALAGLVAVAAEAETDVAGCRESEVVLDAMHSVSRLEQCEEQTAPRFWHLDRIDQVSASLDGRAERANGGAGSVIYVMDTGILQSHAEFRSGDSSRVVAGYDVASIAVGRSDCVSPNKAIGPCFQNYDELAAASHGTAVASVAAGKNVGVAPDAAVVSIRVMNERGLATTRTYLDGLDAIIRHAWDPSSPQVRTAVVNISGWVLEKLGPRAPANLVSYAGLEAKMLQMIAGVDATGQPDPNGKRFLFVVAANNTDGGCGEEGRIDRYPALLGSSIEGMITVGGMTADNRSWGGSCRGGVEILAPAQGIFCATITAPDHYRGSRPNLRAGTSFAAPIVSGIAARLLADRPDLTPQQVEEWILATPSRVWDPSPELADGKVAYVRSIAD